MSNDNITFIGIDNRTNGSIGIIDHRGHTSYLPMPTVRVRGKKIIDLGEVKDIISSYVGEPLVIVTLPIRTLDKIKQTYGNLQSVLEQFYMTLIYINRKSFNKNIMRLNPREWSLTARSFNERSRIIGIEQFPTHSETIKSIGNATGILLADHARKYYVEDSDE